MKYLGLLFGKYLLAAILVQIYLKYRNENGKLPEKIQLARPYVKPLEHTFKELRHKWKYASTKMVYENTTWRFGMLEHPNIVHESMPAFFRGKVLYGMSAMNPGGFKKAAAYNELAHAELGIKLKYLKYPPSAIYNCTFDYGKEYSTEQGYIVQYDRLPMAPETELDILFQAKRYGQAHVVKWSSHRWGSSSEDHVSIIQEIVTTSGGLQTLEAKGSIYLITPYS